MGQNLYEITYKYFPLVRNQYSILILIIFTTLFFILASGINLKNLPRFSFNFLSSLFKPSRIFKKNTETNDNSLFEYNNRDYKLIKKYDPKTCAI